MLRPEDATLNDHLGDAYWRVGREREARFQWDQALKLNPEPADAEKMRQKLEKGLPPAQPRQAKRGKDVRSDGAPQGPQAPASAEPVADQASDVDPAEPSPGATSDNVGSG